MADRDDDKILAALIIGAIVIIYFVFWSVKLVKWILNSVGRLFLNLFGNHDQNHQVQRAVHYENVYQGYHYQPWEIQVNHFTPRCQSCLH